MRILLFSLCSLILVCQSPAGTAQRGPARPNILFCFADDWGRYASIYATLEKQPSLNQVVKTPNIDRVAREGVLFRHAFVNAPSCTPSRSSLLSGRYFFNTGRGAILQTAEWDSSIPSYPHLLRDAGYHIGETYKVWSPGAPVDAPFGAGKHAYERAGNLPNNFSENVTKMMGEGQTLEAARAKIYDQVRANFEAFLADRKAGQPWHYWFGATTTHRRWIKGSGKKLWGIDPDALKGKLPPFLPDVPEVREDVADYLGEVQAWDAYIGLLLKKLEETGELENTLILVSGDHGMPGVTNGKCNLYDFGTGVALVARLPKGMGGRGNGGNGGNGRFVDDLISLVDLAPTFLEAAGVAIPAGMNARSFLDVLRSEKSGQVDASRTWVISGRERHVAFANENNLPYPQRALRTREFLYIRNLAPERWPLGTPHRVTETSVPGQEELESETYAAFADMDASPTKAWLVLHRNDAQGKRFYDIAFARRPAEELYDLIKDPHQLKNVAADPAYAKDRAKLQAQLMKILTDAGDPRVTGDGKTFERPPFTNPSPQERQRRPKSQ
jgi:N-sulfoglucosamine sulfohydrolase